ncbi:THUMP domain-containing class I SAM-dependent RNA methyltransferase [Nitrosomonas mobilis]|uniref:Ribosomal RNA large subunit methyltransferase L n=1 Tax=Nitrosomonas mobilis TaxID=51642 RepID=A0A1G5SEL3_9PROT|nr:THUMP domain-containing protein [Nitrosomonas mobilis]SCZ84859.1 Ribosomal RNA large subunit methyltransferase L [Nitrosomonas mobilis]
MTEHFFATCPRGLETVLAEELNRLNIAASKPLKGGVAFQGDWAACYRINLQSRIASRILWQVAKANYQNENTIYEITYALPWQDWFTSQHSIRVNLTAIKSPLRSLDFATLRIKDAICDQFRRNGGERPSVDTANPDIRIHAFLEQNQLTLYLDTSGEALFKRGLRQSHGEAPLRENLAAGLLALSGWTPSIPLLDPMCGSGTLLLEAAQIACRIAPGSGRHFAFEKLSFFDAALWSQMRQAAIAQQQLPIFHDIYGSDLYGDALADAHNNLNHAGLTACVRLKQANVLEISAPAPSGILLTNPPYGVRVGDAQSLLEFYPKLGDVLKRKFRDWRAYLFTADPMLAKLIRLSPSRRTPLFNGALECRLLEYKLVAGGMRKLSSAQTTPIVH